MTDEMKPVFSIMLFRALLQTSLVLWLTRESLQGGVKPQSVSWGRVLPARGVGVGVKPGVAGALGAMGNRYGNKAMKTGIGRYPGAQLGAGGYRSLGLGGRSGLKQGGYGNQGAYGASLGTGMGLGTGLPNGHGLGMGQGAKRGYGAGLGNYPGYGAMAGMGYPGARPGLGLGYPTGQRAEEQIPGVSAADLGGPELAGLGQAVQELKRKKSRALALGMGDRMLVPDVPVGRGGTLGSATELQTGGEVRSFDPVASSSNGRSTIPLEQHSQNVGPASQAHGGESYEPTFLKRESNTQHGVAPAGGGLQLPLQTDDARNPSTLASPARRGYEPPIHRNQRASNCGPPRDLPGLLGIHHREHPGPEWTPSSVLQPRFGEDGKHLGHAQEIRGNVPVLPKSKGTGEFEGLVPKGANGPGLRGTVTVESPRRGSLNLQGRESFGLAVPRAGGGQRLGLPSVEEREAQGFTAEGQEALPIYHAGHGAKEPKALGIPRDTGRNNPTTRYMGGAGNYLGAGLGAGGYGAALGQGAYLGGAAGKLGAAAALGQGGYPQGVPGKANGYGEGATGYLGAGAGNGYGGDAAKALAAGYGNGYSDGYGAGLGYPSELADRAENKAGKREALGTGGYAGQVQGAYGGGAAQVPYGNAPVIPTGLEAEGAYPYAAQALGLTAEGGKTSNKYGYGAQLGVNQEALGEHAGKYGGAHGKGYKG